VDEDASEEHAPKDHDMEDPQKNVDRLRDMITYKRRPGWAREAIQGAERYGASDGSSREKKRPRPFSSYVALLCGIIDVEPTNYEATEKKV